MDIEMAWEELKATLFSGNQEDINNMRCPECNGAIKSSLDNETGSYTIQCQECWTMIRGH